MHSWGMVVGNFWKALWANRTTFPQYGAAARQYVGKPINVYTVSLYTVPTFFHGKIRSFQSVKQSVLPTIHTTYKNKYFSKKFLIVNRSA